VELYRPNRSEQKSEIKEDYQVMVKLDKKINLKPKGINSNIPSSLLLPSSDKEIKIQVDSHQN
jgi:hypothetical protein